MDDTRTGLTGKGLALLEDSEDESLTRPHAFFPAPEANLRNREWEASPGSIVRAFLEGGVFLSLFHS